MELMPHMCHFCEELFSTITLLEHHISTIHENLKPYQCKKCEKSFGEQRSLKKHFSKIHENASEVI